MNDGILKWHAFPLHPQNPASLDAQLGKKEHVFEELQE